MERLTQNETLEIINRIKLHAGVEYVVVRYHQEGSDPAVLVGAKLHSSHERFGEACKMAGAIADLARESGMSSLEYVEIGHLGKHGGHRILADESNDGLLVLAVAPKGHSVAKSLRRMLRMGFRPKKRPGVTRERGPQAEAPSTPARADSSAVVDDAPPPRPFEGEFGDGHVEPVSPGEGCE